MFAEPYSGQCVMNYELEFYCNLADSLESKKFESLRIFLLARAIREGQLLVCSAAALVKLYNDLSFVLF